MYTVKINRKLLNSLKMLMDWQLREMGFDPDSITATVFQMEDEKSLKGKTDENGVFVAGV